jgi:hypothetical protein
VTATSRTTLLFLVVLFASGCGGGFALPAAEREAYRKAFDETLIEREPLCIEAGPFPYRSGTQPDPWRGIGCDKCQQLEAAGFLVRRIDDAGVTYDLSDAGRPLYRRAPDPEWVDVVRARMAQQGRAEAVDEDALARPRLCFGRTRFHEVVAALAPMSFAGNSVRSVRIAAVATDTSGLLFDPRVATLGLALPPKPEPGQPALYPPRVVSFEWVRGEPAPTITDLRYGAWVDEP